MIRSEMPESEAFCSRTVCKDGVVQFTVQCIGSGDDLDPFLVDFGRWDWVGVSGSSRTCYQRLWWTITLNAKRVKVEALLELFETGIV
jgi:hypothetical protein